MTAQELYDGVARAVEAAKPAQEYCFLWINHWSTCMTKGEWSGWMQAIGSVVAIFASVCLLRYEIGEQRLHTKRVAVSKIRTFVALLSANVERYIEDKHHSALDMERLAALTREQVSMAAQIPAELLDLEWIAFLESARSIGIQVAVLLDAVRADRRLGAALAPAFKELQGQLGTIEKGVIRDHPGVKIWPQRRR